MTILSYQTIRKLCIENSLILPWEERTHYEGVSFGLSAAGYDVRIEFDGAGLLKRRFLKPGEFILASTIERFVMPMNLVGIVHDKSTWARRGLAVQNTVIEPGWEGWLTLELTNHGNDQILLTRGVGIAQIIFHKLDESTNLQCNGKYQNQERGPVKAKFQNEKT